MVTVNKPEPSRAKAIFFPLGEMDGSVATLRPVVICFRPLPSLRTRKSCAGCVPCCGEAENTIHGRRVDPPAAVAIIASPSTANAMATPVRIVFLTLPSTPVGID
jgi:hypothetical protein